MEGKGVKGEVIEFKEVIEAEEGVREFKEVIEVKAVCFAKYRRSSVPLDNTTQQFLTPNSYFLISRLALCCRAGRSTSYD